MRANPRNNTGLEPITVRLEGESANQLHQLYVTSCCRNTEETRGAGLEPTLFSSLTVLAMSYHNKNELYGYYKRVVGNELCSPNEKNVLPYTNLPDMRGFM